MKWHISRKLNKIKHWLLKPPKNQALATKPSPHQDIGTKPTCYREFTLQARKNMNEEAKVSSADGSNLGPTGVVICSLLLGTCEQKFIVCKNLLHPVISGLGFAQDFRVRIDRNNQDQLYLYQDHKPLTYSKPNSLKHSTIFSVECKESRLIRKPNILLSLEQ